MKTLLLTFIVVSTATLAIGQGTLAPGQSFIYQFDTLLYESLIAAGSEPSFTSYLGTNLTGAELLINMGPSQPPSGASLNLSIFQSNDTSVSPVNTGTYSFASTNLGGGVGGTIGGAFPHLAAVGAWQDLHGAIELSVPTNSSAGIQINSFVVRAFLQNPSGGRDTYVLNVPFASPVPEPSTCSLTICSGLFGAFCVLFANKDLKFRRTKRCRQPGMAVSVPLCGSRWLGPRA